MLLSQALLRAFSQGGIEKQNLVFALMPRRHHGRVRTVKDFNGIEQRVRFAQAHADTDVRAQLNLLQVYRLIQADHQVARQANRAERVIGSFGQQHEIAGTELPQHHAIVDHAAYFFHQRQDKRVALRIGQHAIAIQQGFNANHHHGERRFAPRMINKLFQQRDE